MSRPIRLSNCSKDSFVPKLSENKAEKIAISDLVVIESIHETMYNFTPKTRLTMNEKIIIFGRH